MGNVDLSKDPRAFWNAKARTFPRFENKEDNYEAGMLRLARENGVDFRGKSVLDVGCGSGMYTIRIAKEAERVTALDFSEEMLRILEEDAKAAGTANITAVRASWDDFDTPERFDIVFASMTPAIRDDAAREKLTRFSRGWVVFMGFSDRMASDVMSGLLERYGLAPRVFTDAQDVRAWLDANGIAYKALPVNGEWHVASPREKLLDSCLTSLRNMGANPDEDFVARHLESFRNDSGEYVERTKYTSEIILWQKA